MTEFEVKIPNIDKDAVRQRLISAGAVQQESVHTLRNVALFLPSGHEIQGGWLRVRDEGKEIAMSLKIIGSEKIENQKEFRFVVKDFDEALEFLELIGSKKKSFQEKNREIWILDECEVVIDEWPFLEPLIEVEGPSESAVIKSVEKLGYDYSKTRVCSTSVLYAEKYGVSEKEVNDQTPVLTFSMSNPFEKAV
ncbi:MAG: CYTH domain-containing protein [Patescibacteria group bacterium]